MAEPKDTGIVTSQIDLESTNANLSPEKKGTPDDQRDMFRMGKAQELRVSLVIPSIHKRFLTSPAKFPVCLHFRLLHDSHGQLGNNAGVSSVRSNARKRLEIDIGTAPPSLDWLMAVPQD